MPSPTLFDDHNPCTTDTCDVAKGGIVNEAIPGCASTAGATPLAATSSAGVGESTAFLYSGANPVQTGVAAGTIDTERAAVIRGRVLATDGTTPAPGAIVTILGHSEYGQTTTRADGFYDLAVNGGGVLTVQIVAGNALKLQRTANTKARGWTVIDDVVLTEPYTSVDAFTPAAPAAQFVRGAMTPLGTDADLPRRATIYFPPNTNFTNFTPPAGPLAVQVTEFTRGNGLLRMPGALPPTSGYTYAVEVGIPSAAALGIEDVIFDKDVVLYVDNFTNSPVGQTVPIGHYDRSKGAWMAERSGRIVKIISVTSGVANVDSNGDGFANAADLTFLPMDVAERTALAAEYPVGKQLWRSAVRHFSAWDANWGFGPPPGSKPPPPPVPKDHDPNDPCEREGSIIGCESRTLGEKLPIVGTPFSLHYQSRRTAGFRSRLRFKLSDAVVPPGLLRAYIDVEAAGRRYHYVKTSIVPNETFTWTWDGLDAYDRVVNHGSVDVRVRVGFEYAGTQTFETPIFGASGPGSGPTITGDRAARTVTLWSESVYPLARSIAKDLGFGGWTLDANHLLDNNDTLVYGNGRRRSLDTQGFAVDTVAGGGNYPNFNDGGQAVGAYLGAIADLVHAPDGTLYVLADSHTTTGARVRRISANGTIQTIAGLPPLVPRSAGSDGSDALHAQTAASKGVMAPDGSLVFVEPYPNNALGFSGSQVWKITAEPTPKLRLVAGSGAPSAVNDCAVQACGDGGPATAAKLLNPTSLAVARDGSIFVVDSGHSRVRRIGPEGTITTYFADAGDRIEQVAIAPDGSILGRRSSDSVVRIEPNGSTRTVLEPNGNPSNMHTWCNTSASFYGAFVPLADDSILLTCYEKAIVRSPSGRIVRIAGSETSSGFGGDGGPALRGLFAQLHPVALGNANDIFVGDRGSSRIRRFHRTLGGSSLMTTRVPSEDGSEIYEFSLGGRHERTVSALGGVPRFTFGYDPTSGQLSSITDAAGNMTQIARAGSGVTITAPFGQVTQLALDTNGYLASVTNPVATEVTQLVHSTSGLLTAFTDPRGGKHQFEYAPDGRLTRDVDATPGSPGTRLTTLSDATGWTVEIASPEGRVTRHKVDDESAFADTAITQRRTVSMGSLATVSDKSVDGAVATTRPDGTVTKVLSTAADPRWGVAASYPNVVETIVGGRSSTVTEVRTAALAVPGDPFSVSTQTIETKRTAAPPVPPLPQLPPATTTRVFTAGPPAKWTTTSAEGVVVEETLDNLERVVQTNVFGSSPVALHPLSYSYDAHGRVDQVVWGSRVFTTAYNAGTGWADSTTAPAALGVTYTARDANGRPTAMTLPGNRALAMSYDTAGNVVSVTPPSDLAAPPSHAFSFEPNNRMASYMPPDLVPALSPKDTTYGRDLDGLLLAASHPSKSVSYAYDTLGRLSRRVDVVTTSHTYDAVGRLSTVISDGVTLTNQWSASLLTQQAVSGPFAHALNKEYDNFLRVSSWNIDGVGSVAVGYDRDDRVTSAGGMSLTRGTNGLLTGTTVGVVSDTFGYNAYGEVTSHAVTGAAQAFNVTTTRDAAGRIDVRTETIGGVTKSYRYGYDAAGRLSEVYENGSPTPTRSWSYDANGNRSDGTYDAQDRLETMPTLGASFTYGNNGELATKSDASGVTSYNYDAHGNLRSVTPPVGGAISYIIDGENRRIGKKVGGSFVQGFIYDGSRIVAELDSAGAVVARFVYTTGEHSPDVMIKAGTTYRIVKDHLGSPRMVVASSGAVAQRLDYDEWGVLTTDSAPGFQPFGFAGGLRDRDTNLVRFGARDYDPATGRWTTKDEVRFLGGLNHYGYTDDDPINYVDSSGRWAVVAVGAGAAALAAGAAVYWALHRAAHPTAGPAMPTFPHYPYPGPGPTGGAPPAPPWGPPAPPVPDTGPDDRPAPDASPDSGPGTCGKDKYKKSGKKKDRCIAKCRHLLPDGDYQSAFFHACVAKCMAGI